MLKHTANQSRVHAGRVEHIQSSCYWSMLKSTCKAFIKTGCLVGIMSAVFPLSILIAGPLDKTGQMWSPYLEWSVTNTTHSGNPFDLRATVTFTYTADPNRKHSTEMFYDGNNKWKFRFTGTRKGLWTFTTSSTDADLNGLSGTVTINSNPNPQVTGFLTHQGNKFAVQTGDNGTLKGFLMKVYQTDDSGPYKHTHITTFENDTVEKMTTYVTHAKSMGFTAVYVMLNHNLINLGSYSYTDLPSQIQNDPDRQVPDLETFSILDDLIRTAHQHGMKVYFWRWGDQSRGWVPTRLAGGGLNGSVDQRITRYFAARLGPLPGWAMGYGFDLHEWTTKSQLNTWANDFQGFLGWQHLLSARSLRFDSSMNRLVSYSSIDAPLTFGLKTSANETYSEIKADLDSYTDAPHFYEERHVKNRFTSVKNGNTTQFMWNLAMAGGMGCWFGSPFGHDPVFGTGQDYTKKNALKSHQEFWKDRFLLDLEVVPGIVTNGVALATPDRTKYILYRTGTNAITADLSDLVGNQPVVAVKGMPVSNADAGPYTEIALDAVSSGQHTFTFDTGVDNRADWAIAIGDFGTSSSGNPNALISGSPQSGESPLTVNFIGLNSTPGESSGSIANYSWTFGDGGTSTSANPSHTYTDDGTYTVRLTVQDNNGKEDSATKSNYITVAPDTTSPAAPQNLQSQNIE